MRLSLNDIFMYAKCTCSSRNLIEGEQVINSNHIVLCGKVQIENDANTTTIKSLVIQSSKLTDMPHEITGKLCMKGNSIIIINFACTCKAGTSECCKHIVAVLLYLNRNHIEDIQTLSSTDIKCEWSKLKQPSLDQYKPVPISEFCCVKKSCRIPSNITTISNSGNLIRNEFISVSGNSAIAAHSKGRNGFNTKEQTTEHIFNYSNLFLITEHELLTEIQEYSVLNLGTFCEKTLSKLEEYSLNYIRITSETDKSFWHNVRQFRITGSRRYQLYTFNQRPKSDEEWSRQAIKYFWPKLFSNKYIKHGIEYEIVARELYVKKTAQVVVQSGFITSNKARWLGYSPDGVILHNLTNTPFKLLEIKCPFKGKTLGCLDLLNCVKFIVKDIKGDWVIKEKHAYYAQVQLGMLLLNVSCCDFLIYSSFDDNYYVIPV